MSSQYASKEMQDDKEIVLENRKMFLDEYKLGNLVLCDQVHSSKITTVDKDNIDSFTAQKIATTLWKSYDKLFFGNGEKIHYKKYNSLSFRYY